MADPGSGDWLANDAAVVDDDEIKPMAAASCESMVLLLLLWSSGCDGRV